jgi:hypothetical protein
VTSVETLRAAKAILVDKARWTRFTYARNSKGERVPPNDPCACSFCAVGALARVLGLPINIVERDAEVGKLLNRAAGGVLPYSVNDGDGYDAVMAMYDRAIEFAAAEASNV